MRQCRSLLAAAASAAANIGAVTTTEKVRALLPAGKWLDELRAMNLELKPQFIASVTQQEQGQEDADTLFSFFSWAQQQNGFVHEAAPYEAMLQVLRASNKLQDVDTLLAQVMRNPHNMTFKLMVDFVRTYTEAGKWDKAFDAFTGMCKFHRPSITVCNAVLHILVKAGDWEHAEEFIRLLFQWDCLPNDDTFRLLMDTFFEGQQQDAIYNLFEKIIQLGYMPSFGLNRPLLSFLCQATTAEEVCRVTEKIRGGGALEDVVTCNSIMHSFCACGKSEEADRFFSLATQRGCVPDGITYRILVLGLGKGGKLDRALELFKVMRSIAAVDVKTCNIVVDLLCRNGRVDEGFEVVHSMMKAGPHPDSVTCNIMLDGLVKSNKLQHALKLFNTMMGSVAGFEPDAFTYNILTQALCSAGRMDEACSHLAAALKNNRGGISHDSLYDALIAGLCKAGKYEQAVEVFNKISKPCLVTYNTVLGACVKCGRMERAWEIYEQMKSRNKVRDVFTLNTLIQPLCKSGEVDKALQLFEEMRGCHPNEITYGHLVDALCKAGRVEEAEELLVRTRFNADVVVLTTLISGYFRAKRVEEACRIFDKMQSSSNSSRIAPNLRTFNVVISGLCKAGRMDQAEAAVQEMKAREMRPDSFTLSSLVDGFCRSGQLGSAKAWLHEAKGRGEATLFMYNAIIGKLCKLGRVHEAQRMMLEEMMVQDDDVVKSGAKQQQRRQRCVKADAVTFTSLIAGHCRRGAAEEAARVLGLLVNAGVPPVNGALPFNMAVNALCKSGRVDQAAAVVNMMEGGACATDVITYNTLMDGLLKCGRPEEGRRVFDRMVNAGCAPDALSHDVLRKCLAASKTHDKLPV